MPYMTGYTDEVEKAFVINAGFGLDINLTDLLVAKFDTIYNYSFLGNHSLFVNLGFGLNFSFYTRKEKAE